MPQDGQSDRTARTTAATLSDLLQEFGDRWRVAYQPELGVWSGEQESTAERPARFLAADSAGELAGMLSERAEP